MNPDNDFKPLRKSIKRKSGQTEDNFILPYAEDSHLQSATKQGSVFQQSEIEKLRYNNSIEVDDESCPAPIKTFEQADLPEEILEYLFKNQIYAPTAVQMQAIPILLSGRDIVAVAPTGSGKTFSYLLPLYTFLKRKIQKSASRGGMPVALIITPTRELMQQVLETARMVFDSAQINQSSVLKKQNIYGSTTEQNVYENYNQYIHGNNIEKNMFQNSKLGQSNVQNPYQHSIEQNVYDCLPYHVPHASNSSSNSLVYQQQHPLGASSVNNSNAPPYNMQLPHSQPFPKQMDFHSSYSIHGICGGVPMKAQIEQMKQNVDVVVATPGRLIDLTLKGFLDLSHISYLVIDECDKMLDMGLEEQLRKLMAMITVSDMPRQVSLWSATLPSSLERLARSAVLNPVTLHVGLKDTVSRNISQNITFMHSYQKPKRLLQTLRSTQYPPVLVFASSVAAVDEVVELLKDEEFHVEGLHSQKDQRERFAILSDFRDGNFDVLVATDLASRGLDIPGITHVINYETPGNIEDYIHRCGRTGRFGRPGSTTTFLTLDCKIASELKDMLESSGVAVPKGLEDTKQFGKKVLKTEFGDRVM